jgi:hypothetical protein
VRLGSQFRGQLTAMEYAHLGRTGIEVSRLCLGTVNFGSLGNGDHDECIRVIPAFDEAVRFANDRRLRARIGSSFLQRTRQR